jgi:hypothetical protein
MLHNSRMLEVTWADLLHRRGVGSNQAFRRPPEARTQPKADQKKSRESGFQGVCQWAAQAGSQGLCRWAAQATPRHHDTTTQNDTSTQRDNGQYVLQRPTTRQCEVTVTVLAIVNAKWLAKYVQWLAKHVQLEPGPFRSSNRMHVLVCCSVLKSSPNSGLKHSSVHSSSQRSAAHLLP